MTTITLVVIVTLDQMLPELSPECCWMLRVAVLTKIILQFESPNLTQLKIKCLNSHMQKSI